MHTYVPISPPSCVSLPPSLSHPSRSSQSTELISLCYMLLLPTSYWTFGSAYMSMLLSLRPSFPLPPCVLKSILHVYIFIPALQLGSSVPFFFIPYICVRIQYLFFSSWFTSLCMTDSRSIHLTTNNMRYFRIKIFYPCF